MFAQTFPIKGEDMENLQRILMPVAEKLDSNRYLTAIKNGFFAAMPLLIIGSIFLLFTQIPIPAYLNFMESVLGENWMSYFLKVNSMAMDVMTIYVLFGIAKNLASYYKIDEVSGQAASVFAFLILTPTFSFDGASYLPVGNFGAAGLFVGMLSAIFAIEIFRLVTQQGWTIKMPDSVPANVARSFEALIPALIVAIVFNFVRIGFSATSFETAHNFIFTVLQTPLLAVGKSLPATLFVLLLEALFWSFGIHGSNIIGSVMTPIYTALTVENATAVAAGNLPTNIINGQFYNNFVKMGGTSGTIGLAIAMVFFSKSQQYKTLGKLSIGPAIFNINEPLVFGVPIVLNPIMLIPFIATPLVLAVVAYAAFATGLVPIANGANLPWTMPPIFAGFIVSGWRGALLQAVQIGISFGMYYVFFSIEDRRAYAIEQGEVPATE